MHQLAEFFGVEVSAFLEPREGVAVAEEANVPLFAPIDAEPAQPVENYPPVAGPDDLLNLLLNRRVKAIYRVELSVTELKYESS